MRRRVFLIAADYCAHPRLLPPERRDRPFLAGDHAYPRRVSSPVFFRYPRRGVRDAEGWANLGTEPLRLADLLASAAHRAICSLHELVGGAYSHVRDRITDLFVTAMPGLDPSEDLNVGLLPQSLRGTLDLSFSCRCDFLVGTSDSGAWTLAKAVRHARSAETPATVLVTAGQIIPSGYLSQYQIRSVLGPRDQAEGLDMLAVGDLLMDVIRRNHGVSPGRVEELLARVSARKLTASRGYPAAFRSAHKPGRETRRTRYFADTDIAPPLCGAAAVILTSDPELVSQVCAARSERHGRAAVVEVLGVGEGGSNPHLLARQSPLLFAPAISQAIASAADDARVPPTTFPASAFAVLHDAFPSIEMAFLLSLGFGWEQAAARMGRYWPNPFGGLLAFGHALGASGLVQVAKAFHIFSDDRTYVHDPVPPDPMFDFPDEGATAFSSSVGGPLSHIVITLMRGGWRAGAEPPVLPQKLEEPVHATAWHRRRQDMRDAADAYLRDLDDTAGAKGRQAWLVEGTTEVNIRSCLHALTETDIDALSFSAVEVVVAPLKIDEARSLMREFLRERRIEWELDLSGIHSRLDTYDEAVLDLAGEWRQRGFLDEAWSGKADRTVAGWMKARLLRVPIAVLRGRSDRVPTRQVLFLPLPTTGDSLDVGEIDDVDLVYFDEATGSFGGERGESAFSLLPFWHSRATRPSGPLPPGLASAGDLATHIRTAGDVRTWAELSIRRAFVTPLVPPAGVLLAFPPNERNVPADALPAAFVEIEIAAEADLVLGGEVLARAIEVARGWLGGYLFTAHQQGGVVSVVCLDERRRRGALEVRHLLMGAVRFARDVALWCRPFGLRVASAISLGEAFRFQGAEGAWTVGSTQGRAAGERLRAAAIDSGASASICVDVDDWDPVALVNDELEGWEPREGEHPWRWEIP